MGKSNRDPSYSQGSGWVPQEPGSQTGGTPSPIEPVEQKITLGRFLIVGAVVASAWLTVSRLGGLSSVMQKLRSSSDPQSKRTLAASDALSQHERADLGSMKSQEQAERLLERAINRYPGAFETILQGVDGWRGSIRATPRLKTLVTTALNSSDLRVREAAIEVNLAAHKILKSPDSVSRFIDMAKTDGRNRPYALWMLGMLGNRGVETERVQETLLSYTHDPEQQARYWAVEGLAISGGEAIITPLLDVLHNDPALQIRERAACGLAQSGMLTQQERLRAVPNLLSYLDDPALDGSTRGWVYQALHDITGQNLPNDPAQWRSWYTRQGH